MAFKIPRLKNLHNFELATFLKYGNGNKETGRRWNSKYFLTSPIFYVNAEPHIGHLYTALIGDAALRFQKLKNSNLECRYMVGTDEHGLKVSKAAERLKLEEKIYCDKISAKYRQMFNLYNIEVSDFIRTTEERHIKGVTALWNKIFSKDLIYKDNYSGWYCVSDEAFVSEIYLKAESSEDKKIRYTLEGNKPVQFVTEVNYKFKLSKFQADLLDWLKDSSVIKPNKFQNLLHRWIIDGEALQDISVSRPVERVPWGIPVPEDSSQTIYVWLDALASYLTSNGYPNESFKWPPDVQIIGMDILKFHGIYWPAFLMAADLNPPDCIICHSHWIKDGEKMSKSKGNVVDPFQEADKYTSDGFRYFLLREGVLHSDGNFTDLKVTDILNSELSNSLGNLLNRCTSSALNPDQIFPIFSEGDHQKYGNKDAEILIKSLQELPDLVKIYFEEFNFHKGIVSIILTVHLVNKFFQEKQAWTLAKIPEQKAHVNYVLHMTMESLRVCGILLQPIIPNICNNLLGKLSIDKNKRTLNDIRPFSWELSEGTRDSKLTPENVVLFPKLRKVN